MNTVLVSPFLALAAVTLGLRTTSLLIPRVHPVARLVVSLLVGAIFTITTLQVSASYQVYDMGLGLLVAMSPAGVFDGLKWWYRWGK